MSIKDAVQSSETAQFLRELLFIQHSTVCNTDLRHGFADALKPLRCGSVQVPRDSMRSIAAFTRSAYGISGSPSAA